MKLEQVVHRIATDAAFAAAVRQDLEGTLAKEGIHLAGEEVAALEATLADAQAAGDLLSKALDPIIWHSPQFGPQTS
jgi:hypothetical protein